MGTRSTIAMEFPNGTVEQIYCHYDGYLDHNGRILAKHYTAVAKIAGLLAHGDLSVLGPELGEKHPFDNPHRYGTDQWQAHNDLYRNWCLFYGRDRGEADTQSRKFADIKDFEVNGQREQYNYVFRNGQWFVSDDDGKSWAKLARVLELLNEEQAA